MRKLKLNNRVAHGWECRLLGLTLIVLAFHLTFVLRGLEMLSAPYNNFELYLLVFLGLIFYFVGIYMKIKKEDVYKEISNPALLFFIIAMAATGIMFLMLFIN